MIRFLRTISGTHTRPAFGMTRRKIADVLRHTALRDTARKYVIVSLCSIMLIECVAPGYAAKESPSSPEEENAVYLDADVLVPLKDTVVEANDSVITVVRDENSPYGLDGKIPFNPSPTRAIWISALFPGLGQIYNRRYWKLPIIVGGFMGLGYATNWNNNQLQDYTQAYIDITDSDPASNSYMNFFPPTTSEGDLDKTWLTNTLRTRRDYYRRYRDLCIICMVGLYLLCIVDSYVDATLVHFDISDNLSLDVAPALMVPDRQPSRAGIGLSWALNF